MDFGPNQWILDQIGFWTKFLMDNGFWTKFNRFWTQKFQWISDQIFNEPNHSGDRSETL